MGAPPSEWTRVPAIPPEPERVIARRNGMKMNPLAAESVRKLRPDVEVDDHVLAVPVDRHGLLHQPEENRSVALGLPIDRRVTAVGVGHAGARRIEGDPDGPVLARRHVGLAEQGGGAVLEVEQVEDPVGPGHGNPARGALRGVGLGREPDVQDVDVHPGDTIEGEGRVSEEDGGLALAARARRPGLRGWCRPQPTGRRPPPVQISRDASSSLRKSESPPTTHRPGRSRPL